MGEYFGFNIGERDDGDWQEYLSDVDPKYHLALTRAMAEMCAWYGDKDYREMDGWFTTLYGLVLELEDVLECNREHPETPLTLDVSVKND